MDDGSERIFFYDKTLDLIGYSSFADDGVQDVIFGTGDVLAIDYDEADDKIVFSNSSNQVWLYNGDGSVDRQLATAAGEVTSVQYYAAYKKVYFVANETIWSVNVDGSGLDDMLVLTGTGVTDLAVEADQTIPTVTSRYPADGQTGITIGETFTLDFTEQIRKSPDAAMGSQRWYALSELPMVNRWIRLIAMIHDCHSQAIPLRSPALTTVDLTQTITSSLEIVLSKIWLDFNFIGYTTATQWNFTTGTFVDDLKFYSIKSGDFDDPTTWSHESHSGTAGTTTPGTGSDVEIGPGHTVTLQGPDGMVGVTTGLHVAAGGTFDLNHQSFEIWGDFRIDGTLVNGGILSGIFDLYSTGLPIFDEIQYGHMSTAGAAVDLHTNVVAYTTTAVNGGILNTNGFQVCTPPNYGAYSCLQLQQRSMFLNITWTGPGAGSTLIVVREAGTAAAKPQFGVGIYREC